MGIILLKFNLAEASQTVFPLCPLQGLVFLIYHDQLPTLMAMIHFLVHMKEQRAAGFGASAVRGARNERKEKGEDC